MKCRAIMNLSTEILLRYYDNDVSMFQEWHFVFSYISGFFGLLIFRRASLVTEIPDTVDSIGYFILIMLLGNNENAQRSFPFTFDCHKQR